MATTTEVSALDFIDPSKHAAIIDRTSTDDVTVELQAWLDFCKANSRKGIWPAGVYNISAPLWITKLAFETNRIQGDGKGFALALSRTTIIASQTDTPAIIIQNGRSVFLSDIHIIGGNTAPTTIGTDAVDDPSVYITPGFRDSRYSPHCGICIDATVGNVPPDGGYPGLTGEYQGRLGGTAEVQIDRVQIEQFVVGFMCSPDGESTQGDTITFANGTIQFCDICASYGQTQSRANVIRDCNLGKSRVAVSGLTHGNQSGAMPKISGNQCAALFRIFEGLNTIDVMSLFNCYAEAIKTIGTWGITGPRTPTPCSILNCHISLNALGDTREAPLLIESNGPLVMEGSIIRESSEQAKSFNIAAISTPTITNCSFAAGWLDNNDASVGNTLDESSFNKPTFAGTLFVTSNDVSPREKNGATTQNVQLMTGVSSVVIGADTIQFDTPDAGSVSIGQLLFWRFLPQGKSLVIRTVPGLQISNIISNLVVCDMLYEADEYDNTAWYGTTLTALVGGS